jgi:hypothetical protein
LQLFSQERAAIITEGRLASFAAAHALTHLFLFLKINDK